MTQPTLKDIARELGFSINTVSRGLRDMSDISQEAKQKILETAERMGYRKNLAASMLRTNRSRAIGVLVSDIGNPVYAGIVKGIEAVCKQSKYTIILANSNELAEAEKIVLNDMIERGVDGILLVPMMQNDDAITMLQSIGIPFATLGRRYQNLNVNAILNDDNFGGQLVGNHLYTLGHRDILYLSAPGYISSAEERLTGLKTALNAQSEETSVKIVEADVSREGGRICMEDCVSDRLNQTAVFAFSDLMAFGAFEALRKAGYRIPEDVSLIGYDNIEFSDLLSPGLTTIDMCKFRLGKKAAEFIVAEIERTSIEPMEIQQLLKEPRLIVRGSTAPPKKIL